MQSKPRASDNLAHFSDRCPSSTPLSVRSSFIIQVSFSHDHLNPQFGLFTQYTIQFACRLQQSNSRLPSWCKFSFKMASIDRYRPPREGYQPPSLPQKPVARLSRSPSARRDVPPAVPSPPTHSSRTSSLPPQSRRDVPSPAHPSPVSASRRRANQWYFTTEEALSSPSVVDGLTPADERLRRAKGVNFIYQAGAMIELPQTTLWVAAVFFHRFYMRRSMVEERGGIHHYVSDLVTVSAQNQKAVSRDSGTTSPPRLL